MVEALVEIPEIPAEALAAIVALVVRTYPQSGNQLEKATALAARLGFTAAYASQQIEREEALAS